MMNQIFRITFVTFIYKRYKQTILSSALLLLVLWLIEKLHQDFVSYSQLNSDTSYLALSFGLKWLAFILVTCLYMGWNLFLKKEKFKKENLSKEELKKYGKLLDEEGKVQDDLLAKMQSLPKNRSEKRAQKKAEKKAESNTSYAQKETEPDADLETELKSKPDPFAQIRDKEKLNSKADFVLKNKQ